MIAHVNLTHVLGLAALFDAFFVAGILAGERGLGEWLLRLWWRWRDRKLPEALRRV